VPKRLSRIEPLIEVRGVPGHTRQTDRRKAIVTSTKAEGGGPLGAHMT